MALESSLLLKTPAPENTQKLRDGFAAFHSAKHRAKQRGGHPNIPADVVDADEMSVG
jgi:hypothetical protein